MKGYKHSIEIVIPKFEIGSCRYCGKKNVLSTGFRDELSKEEYKISGMCQECQDKVFGVD